ncbi:MAG TPA: heavy-metal-associated domain-containing protein [Chryseolinea sp.]|nr:heavy-metal-associated domain-containing protein [Chryseolinea sp.]
MKANRILLATFVAVIAFQSGNAQSGKELLNNRTKTESIKVYGECGMCKKRIEKAAIAVKGVQSANWNEDSKYLTINYDLFKKDVPDNVQQKVTEAGHDTGKYKADDAVYEGLPACCHYSRKQ